MDIIQLITQKAATLSENDLIWILPELYQKYNSTIKNFSVAAKQYDQLSKLAFEAKAKQTIDQAVNTFLFKKKHWQNNYNLHNYLIKTLSNLKSEKLIESSTSQLVNKPICPLCKLDKNKEFLEFYDGAYHCNRCKEIIENNLISLSYSSLYLRKIFASHSRKGVRCPDCKKWVPDSAFDSGVFPCPYNCGFLGNYSEYYSGSHPVALTKRNLVSLDQDINTDSSSKKTISDLVSSSSITDQEEFFLNEDLENQFSLIKEVLFQQQKILCHTTTPATFLQKNLMYQAFINVLDKLPYEMTMYLGHQKNVSKLPLQCQIFQEYSDLIFNHLPFSIIKGKNRYDIVDPCDPRLSLFLGISKYSATVQENGIIPNKTLESYTGGKQVKDYGPCFIGKLISVSSNDIDCTEQVEYYTFNEIKTALAKGSQVQVKHFRIASHYEMHSLVFLQRIRRAVVDKVYYLINKEKRKVRS